MIGGSNDSRVLLDVTRLIWRRWKARLPTGIDRVCLAYLKHFGPQSQAVVQHKYLRRVFDERSSQRLFQLLERRPTSFRRELPLELLRNTFTSSVEGGGRLYLNIGHTGLNSDGFRSWVGKADLRPVYLVHDLIPITHPQYCRAGEADKHRERMRTMLTTAAGIIGNSRATIEELQAFARSESLPMPSNVVAWLGSDGLPVTPSADPSMLPTFVILGTIEARKNHLMLLNLWCRLIDRLGPLTPRLLIIGHRGWEADEVFQALDQNQKLRGHVTELNGCSDEELAFHLRSARALLFPTLTEGFGLPLVEALGLGVPVAASDLPVFREFGMDIPTYLDPNDESAWEAFVLDYSQSSSPARNAQLARMKGFRPSNWHDHFKTVEVFLESLA